MSAPEISAKLVMQLRAQTGLPMMKCKEALEASGGDFSAAVDWLRKKGLETAAKKADRAMKEGRVALTTSPDGALAAMVEVDCETEPVCVGADFRALVDGVLQAVFVRGAMAADAAGDVPAAWVVAQTFGKGPDTVDVTVKQLVAKIGENMAVRRAAALTGGGRLGTYLHFNAKVGVLVQLEGPDAALGHAETSAFLADLGKHVAFAKPVAVSREQITKAAVDKELEIYRDQVRQDPKMAGKPTAVVERIVLGKLDKFYAERCLLEQPWVMDDKQSVKAVLEAVAKKAGGALSVRRFALFQVGGAYVAGDERPWWWVLVKVSGEALSGEGKAGIDGDAVHGLAREIADAAALGVEIAVVNGGGNIVRGAQMAIRGIGRATADYMGMLATVINALALQDVLESLGRPTRVLSAIEMRGVAEPYIRRRAMRHLEKGRVVILAGGSGHPYFTTDTAAALRGSEVGAQALLKATKVDGVYDKDPKRHPDAKRYDSLTFDQVYEDRLEVMDRTAITMCQENALPIVVFDMAAKGNLTRLLRGERVGTKIGFPPAREGDPMAVDDILLESEEKMEGAVAHLAQELRGLRSGRASPHLVDSLRVDYYGAMTPLGQMAQIGCPEPRLIVIKPFDASAIAEIEKAIRTSNLGLNPQSDGKVVRLVLPPLSEERRKQLVKHVKDLGETAHVAIRNVRRDANKAVDASFNDREMTEDQVDDAKEQVQELTKTYEGKVTDLVAKKSAAAME